MWVDKLIRSVTPYFTPFFRQLAHLVRIMWDSYVRFPFGRRPTRLEDEEAMDVDTTPLLAPQEGTDEQSSGDDNTPFLRGFDGAWEAGSHYQATEIGHMDSLAKHKALVHDPPASFVEPDLPPIDSHSLGVLATNMGLQSVLQSSELTKPKEEQHRLRKERPQGDKNPSTAPPDDNQQLMDESAAEADSAIKLKAKGCENSQIPPFSITVTKQMELLLTPVFAKLQNLKATTPESLPSYNPRVRTNRHAQVLKTRLLPIGEFIMQILSQSPEDKRGMLELKLCRHIAAEYWPLPATEMTHLRVQEMYRNALFRTRQHDAPADSGAERKTHDQQPEPKAGVDPEHS